MPDSIRGGDGRHTAKVTSGGRLVVHADVEPQFSQVSEEKSLSYELHPPSRTISGTAYNQYLWMKNTASDKNFHIQYVRYGWNGGSTSYNRIMGFRMYRNASTPTGNQTTGQFGVDPGPHNLNLGSEREPEMDFRFWDGVGTGLTIADIGQQINCGPVYKGATYIQYDGALIMPPSEVLSIAMKGDGEDGSGIAVIAGFYSDA